MSAMQGLPLYVVGEGSLRVGGNQQLEDFLEKKVLKEHWLNAIDLPGESWSSHRQPAVIVPNLPVSIQNSKRSIFTWLKINVAPNKTSLWRTLIKPNLPALKSPAPRLDA